MPSSLTKVVKQAEEAVAGVTDKTLRTKAFELVMQELLQREREHKMGGLGKGLSHGRSLSSRTSKLPRVSRGGLTQRILELVDDAFLKSPKSSREIRAELQRHGHHYSENTVAMALLRLVRKRVLRRVPKSKGKNPIYGYVAN